MLSRLINDDRRAQPGRLWWYRPARGWCCSARILCLGLAVQGTVSGSDLLSRPDAAHPSHVSRTGSGPTELEERASEFGRRIRNRYFRPAAPLAVSAWKPVPPLTVETSLGNHGDQSEKTDSPRIRPSAGTEQNAPLASAMAVPQPITITADSLPQAQATSASRIPNWFEPAAQPEDRTVRASGYTKNESPNDHESLEDFQAALQRKFPGSRLSLQLVPGALFVAGSVADRQAAIQILTLVREKYLVPVVDRLQVPRARPGSQR